MRWARSKVIGRTAPGPLGLGRASAADDQGTTGVVHRRVRVLFWMVLSLLLIIMSVDRLGTRSLAEHARLAPAILDLAGRERMHGQHIALHALSLERSPGSALEVERLESALADLEADTSELARRVLSAPPHMASITGHAHEPRAAAARAALVDLATRTLEQQGAPGSAGLDADALTVREELIHRASHEFLIESQMMVSRMRAAARERVEGAIDVGWAVLIIEIGLALLVAMAVVEPTVRWIRRHEAKLQVQHEELEWLAHMAKRTTNAVIITDVERRVTWVNEGFTRITGYELADVEGRKPVEVLRSPNTDPRTLEAMYQRLSRGRSFQGELLNRAKDGRDYWVFLDMQPRYDGKGSLIGFMAVESDITDRKLAQLQQQRIMAELAGFFECSLELLCIVGLDGRFIKVNAAWEVLLGETTEALRGREFMEFVHPDDVAATAMQMVSLTRGESVDSFRNRYRDRDGGWRTLEWRASSGGGLVYGAARDVTEQIELERALAEQAERTELALAGGELGTWDWDMPTGTLSVDQRWTAMLGETPENFGRDVQTWAERVHPDDLRACNERLDEYLGGGAPFRDVRFRMRHRDGSWRWIQSSGKVVAWDEDGKPTRMVGTHADVTQSVLDESQRAIANRRMELALQAGQMGLWDWDLDTGQFNCDQRWADILGERMEDLVPDASTLLARTHPEDLRELETQIDRHTAGNLDHVAAQCRMRHRDGSWRWVRIFGTSTSDSPGQEGTRLVGIQMDVHEQVLAQSELVRREMVLANTVRMAGIGGWELDLLTNTLRWSDQVRAIHEVERDYVPRLTWAIRFFVGEDRRRVARSIRRAIDHGEPCDLECAFVTARGRRRWVRLVGEPVRVDGAVVRLVGAIQDVTEQRAQSAALVKAVENLESAQSLARMGNWTYDPETDAVEWSPQMYELFDRDPQDGPMCYEEVMAEFAPADAERLDAAVRAAAEHGTAYAFTLPRRSPRGPARVLGLEGRARAREGGGFHLFGTTRDVTAEIEREEALREARLRAEDANRSKTEFLANMSHEIRTPMTAILGYADLLSDAALTEAQRAEYVAIIKRNGEHLLTIINDILDVSKIEAGRMLCEVLECAPYEILRGVVQLMRVKAEAKGLCVEVVAKTRVPALVRTDPTRLRQILVNLLGNAIKFSEHGTVSVSIGYEPGSEPQRAGTLWVEVADPGIGITPEQLDQVFTAFMQADASVSRRFGGTGLGLRISKRLAQMLGGDITVESEPGRGSTFRLSVEAARVEGAVEEPAGPIELDEAASTRALATRSEGDAPLAGVRVLLMEDGPDNLRLLCAHLRRSGAVVTTAIDGREGLTKLTIDGSVDGPLMPSFPFDVIVTDMQMPVLDGYAVVAMLRARGCQLPIVALTAHSMPADKQRCLGLGCDAYAAKPINRRELAAVLLEAMSNRAAA